MDSGRSSHYFKGAREKRPSLGTSVSYRIAFDLLLNFAIKIRKLKVLSNWYMRRRCWIGDLYFTVATAADLGLNTLNSSKIHYSYFHFSMITIALQLQDL